MYMVIINSTPSLQTRKLRHRDVHLPRSTQSSEGAAICSQAIWLQRQPSHQTHHCRATGRTTEHACRRMGQQGGWWTVLEWVQEPLTEKTSVRVLNCRQQWAEWCAHVFCPCVCAHHVDRGWEKGSIPRLKKKKKEASEVCAFEGLQVISGGWKTRRENERQGQKGGQGPSTNSKLWGAQFQCSV